MIEHTGTWFVRRRQRRLDRVARRTFDRLLADPASYRSAPSTLVVGAYSALVLLLAVGAVAGLAWATTRASGIGWFFVGLGWACLIAVRPRGFGLDEDVVRLGRADYPGIHALVGEMARAVGIRPPDVIGVNLDFNAYVAPVGWRGRNALVLGMPFMTLGSWPERLGTIGHELGHLRGGDAVRLRLIGSASLILSGVHYLVAPAAGVEDPWAHGGMAYESTESGVFDDLGRWVQTVLALPFLGLLRLHERLDLASSQHLEYLADRRSAEVVGSASMVNALLGDPEGIRTVTAAAARRDEDPFAVLRDRPALSSDQAAARLHLLEKESARADDTHPLDHLRIKLVQASALPPSPTMPGEEACLRAEAELARLRDRFRREFTDLLVHDL